MGVNDFSQFHFIFSQVGPGFGKTAAPVFFRIFPIERRVSGGISQNPDLVGAPCYMTTHRGTGRPPGTPTWIHSVFDKKIKLEISR